MPDSLFHPLYLLLVLAGSALGGILRYGISGLVGRRFGERFPWGTLVVNLTGAFAIGVLAALWVESDWHRASPGLVFVLAGILGSYTTVSSLSLQTLELARGGERCRSAGYLALSLLGGLAAVGAGFGLGSLAP